MQMSKAPRTALVLFCVTWKILLLVIVLLSQGPGYDTSTQLLLDSYGAETHVPVTDSIWSSLVQKLTRWDAVYFAAVADQGYTLEQEWAFGWGFTRLLAFLDSRMSFIASTKYNAMACGILLANTCHVLSVLILYQLVLALVPPSTKRKSTLAFIAASLHIVAPAGICLVAPYTEAPFSLLNFLGHFLYVVSWNGGSSNAHGLLQDAALLGAGLCFGLAATIRGNGLLSGLLFFLDVVIWLSVKVENALQIRVLNLGGLSDEVKAHMRSIHFRRLPATILAGLILAVGFAAPQYLAFREYCASAESPKRPWCSKIPPSIYSWVQSHYWNVGFLRYWTVSNAPLFLIAAPVLYMMLSSSWRAFYERSNIPENDHRSDKPSRTSQAAQLADVRTKALLFRLALPQVALASAALTSFHVQVITRLSSGYPLWLIILAQDIIDDNRIAKWLTRWNVMYAIIHTALFANFLPPA